MGLEVKTPLEGELSLYVGTIAWGSSGTAQVITGSRVAFCEGVTFSWDETNVPIWDRGSFSHWKKGRGVGELTVPQAYVDNQSMISYLDGTISGSSAPVLQGEIRVLGTLGNMEHALQLKDIALKHFERNEPEGDDKISWSMGFDLSTKVVMGTGSRITT